MNPSASSISALPELPAKGVATDILQNMFPPRAVTPTRVVVIGCGTACHFPWDHACKIYDEACDEVKRLTAAAKLPIEIVTCDTP